MTYGREEVLKDRCGLRTASRSFLSASSISSSGKLSSPCNVGAELLDLAVEILLESYSFMQAVLAMCLWCPFSCLRFPAFMSCWMTASAAGATPIFTDSTGAQAIVSNPCNRARTKHIEIHYHYARQHVAAGKLDYRRVKSSENSNDVLTKPLPRAAHSYCAFMMGLDVEGSKAFDLTALPRDSPSRRRGSPPP